jgi:hypothetical protein
MKYLLALTFILFGCTTQTDNSAKRKEISVRFMKGVWKGDPELDGRLEEWVFMDGGFYKVNQYTVSDSSTTYGFALDSLRWEVEGAYIYSFLKYGGDYQLDYHVEVFSDDSIKLTKGAIFKLKEGKYYRYIWTENGIDTLNNFIRIENNDTVEYSHSTVNGIYSERKECTYSDDSSQCGQMFDTFGEMSFIYIKANQHQVGHHSLKRIGRELKDFIK